VQQKTPSGVAAPPITITAKAVYYNPFRGFPNFKPISHSFVKLKTLSQTLRRPIPLSLILSITLLLLTVPQMVSSSLDPFLPTVAELAGDAPPDGPCVQEYVSCVFFYIFFM